MVSRIIISGGWPCLGPWRWVVLDGETEVGCFAFFLSLEALSGNAVEFLPI